MHKELSFKRMHRGGEGRAPSGQSPSPHIKQNGRQVTGRSQTYFSQVKDSEMP